MRAASLRASAAFLRAADAAAALRFFFSTWAFLVAARASAAFWRASFLAASLAIFFSFLRWACAALASEARRFESARACAAFLREATFASLLRLACVGRDDVASMASRSGGTPPRRQADAVAMAWGGVHHES